MIPWVREKFAEHRAKWNSTRNKRSNVTNNSILEASTDVSSSTHGMTTSKVTTSNGKSGNYTQQIVEFNERNDSNDSSASITSKIIKLKQIHRSPSISCRSSEITLSGSNDIIKSRQTKKIIIRIICPSARVLVFQTDINKRIIELKNEIILEISDDPVSLSYFATDVRQLGPRYRLLKAEYNGVELNENMTLLQHFIENNDTLVLVTRRNYLKQAAMQSHETQSTRNQEIEQATKNVASRNRDMPMVDINEIFQQSNLQFDVRKVVISLAQASAAIIGSGPYASRIIEMLKQKLVNKRETLNDTLQCLVDMGFSKEKAEHALKLHHGIYSTALEWLILHQNDDISTEDIISVVLPKSNSVISPSGIIIEDGIIENTEALLEIVRIYSHRDIPPTTDTVSTLVEMGFEEQNVLNALKRTCNNKAAACEWLCGNRSGSLIELRDGLALDSPILKSILKLPQVQINLSNPKILLAFLSILENENSIRVWGGDSDTTSVITHILQKYHEEKHVLGINQFYSSRNS